MTERRFAIGDEYRIGGLTFRVERGEKEPVAGRGVDFRLDVWTSDGWRSVTMELGFFLADFFTENEDILYPPYASNGKTYLGGKKYLYACGTAYNQGYRAAQAGLEWDKKHNGYQVALWDES